MSGQTTRCDDSIATKVDPTTIKYNIYGDPVDSLPVVQRRTDGLGGYEVGFADSVMTEELPIVSLDLDSVILLPLISSNTKLLKQITREPNLSRFSLGFGIKYGIKEKKTSYQDIPKVHNDDLIALRDGKIQWGIPYLTLEDGTPYFRVKTQKEQKEYEDTLRSYIKVGPQRDSGELKYKPNGDNSAAA